jgi:hypothetical protein
VVGTPYIPSYRAQDPVIEHTVHIGGESGTYRTSPKHFLKTQEITQIGQNSGNIDWQKFPLKTRKSPKTPLPAPHIVRAKRAKNKKDIGRKQTTELKTKTRGNPVVFPYLAVAWCTHSSTCTGYLAHMYASATRVGSSPDCTVFYECVIRMLPAWVLPGGAAQKKCHVGAWSPRGRARVFLGGGALRCLADSSSPSPKKYPKL